MKTNKRRHKVDNRKRQQPMDGGKNYARSVWHHYDNHLFWNGLLDARQLFEVPRYVSLTLGIVFIAYGIFRGYRQYKGIDYTYRRD